MCRRESPDPRVSIMEMMDNHSFVVFAIAVRLVRYVHHQNINFGAIPEFHIAAWLLRIL